MSIPHILHQIWYQEAEELPGKYMPFQQSWLKHHPHWDYRLWDEPQMESLIWDQYPWFYKIWKEYPLMIQRIDSAKWFILHHFGGVYVDMDMTCLRNIEPLIKEENFIMPGFGCRRIDHALLRLTGLRMLVNNCFIACPAQHPLLYLMALEGLRRRQRPLFMCNLVLVLWSTGPSLCSEIVERYQDVYPIKMLPRRVLQAWSEVDADETTYALHISKATWAPKVIQNWKNMETSQQWTIAISVFLIIGLVTGVLLYKRNTGDGVN